MALAAHDRAFFLLLMTALAIEVIGLHQARPVSFILQAMAVRTALILGRLVFNQFAVLINMVAQVTFLDFRRFIVGLVFKDRRGTLGVLKHIVIHNDHIFLGIGSGDQRQNGKHNQPNP
jgi:hypothetical protein